ncbi:cysteine dioxygenase family protein [Nocardiopsis sp. RSe5-2]|uniref:Cysteine dioxygenase family protein n=1 Tax=Nocardiopsis endophytica TaxID=3018445 RepID=A0ABT4U6F0_9ACTN|nr:cysteine dioxygenase family protein [Nocardiopsis endophytica]MDA2812527.1 cysteine dioxygenase family protein [Nocardiopsis endophytica]
MSTASRTATTPRLDALVGAVRAAVNRRESPGRTAELVADALPPFLTDPDLLPASALKADPDAYTQHVLHVEPGGAFSVVALVWLPGQCTPVHDHVAWCVTGVHIGAEDETRYALAGPEGDRHLVPVGATVNGAGSTCGFAPPGDIHRVANAGDGPAVSIHVYGADIGRLGSSVRRVYDLAIRDA